MPEKATVERARRAKRQGKSPSTQAGEFVREEIRHIREGEHGAKSAKQAIAIGLSKARRAGVDIPDEKGKRPTRKAATRKRASPARSKAALKRLKKQPRRAASHLALSRQAHQQARGRTPTQRSRAARKGARTRARASR